MERLIFCPNCTRFVGHSDQCKECGWNRPASSGTEIEVCWTVQLPGADRAPRSTPFPARFTLAGANIILPTAEGEVFALALQSGQVAWQRQIDPEADLRTISLAAWENLVLLGTENLSNLPTHDRHFLAWDAETGQDRWGWPTAADSLSVPLIADDSAYFVSSEPKLYALNLPEQTQRWSADTEAWAPDSPSMAGGVIVVPSRGPVVSAFSAQDGHRLWSFCARDQEMETLHNRPAVSDTTAIFSGWGRRVYAVDLETGVTRWEFSAERGITNAPLLAGEVVFVGVKDLRVIDGNMQPGYSLYALDAANGSVRWKFPTGKHIFSTPVIDGNLIIFGADDRRVHAVDISSGLEQWQYTASDALRAGPLVVGQQVLVGAADGTITCLYQRESMSALEAGTPELAEAAGMALSGSYVGAAQRYAGLGRPLFAAALFLEAGQPQNAADLYIDQQNWELALSALEQAGNSTAAGEILARLGRHDQAASVLEAGGNIELAVREYIAAGRAGYAAQMLWKSGHRKEAAELFRSIHQEDQAAEILVEDGRAAEAAQMYLRMGKLVEAASVYAQAGMHVEAARLNEQLGQVETAAKQFAAGGAPAEALRLYEGLEDWQQVVVLAQAAGDTLRRASALERLGQNELAAQAYEQAGQPEKALALYETAARWEKAAELAGILERWEQQAASYSHMGLMTQAGESYERAAEQLLLGDPNDTAGRAAMFESAAQCYTEAALWQKKDACWEEVCRLRGWPNVKGKINLPGELFQGEYCLANIQLNNAGYSLARLVHIVKVSRKFQIDTSETQTGGIRSLGPQQQRSLSVTLIPNPNVIGMVMLRVTIGYQDSDGKDHESVIEERVRVLGRDEKLHLLEQTPLPGDFTVDFSAEIDLRNLRGGLIEYFNEEDLQDLCFDLRIDYEALPGDTKIGKSRELILFMGRHGRLNELLDTCRQRRPNVKW